MRPNLQIALDCTSINKAIDVSKKVNEYVDILEVGTVLVIAEGVDAISAIRREFPKKHILTDTKCTDAGAKIAKICDIEGTNSMTCSAAAGLKTILEAKNYIDDIRIEMFGNISEDDYSNWSKIGVNHLIYHKSKDDMEAGDNWSDDDIAKVKSLIDRGFNVSITGGITIDNISQFKGLNINTIIVGSAILNAAKPDEVASDFKEKIEEVWPTI